MSNLRSMQSGSGRAWRRQNHKMDNQWRQGHKIICSTPHCGTEFFLPDNNRNQSPPDQIEKRISQKGWAVGRKPEDDLCPNCVMHTQAERRSRQQRRLPAVVVDNTQGEPEVAQTATAPSAQELTRDSRRIIMLKLDESYESAEKGYKAPWTDQAVAKDLGVPVAWVISLREEFFGPARDNDEIRALQQEITQANQRISASIAEAQQLTKDAASIAGKLLNAKSAMEAAQRTLEALLKRADAIAKAVQA